MWDFINSLGSLFSNVAPLANFGVSLYNNFNRPSGGGQTYAPPTPQPQMQFDPSMFMPDMSWLGEMMNGFGDMMAGQQQALMDQKKQFDEQQQKGLARQASTTRRMLQSQGVYGDPNSDTGASGSAAVASMMGIPPDELLAALRGFGKDVGWEV